jgi:hypothetical protein
MKWNTQTVVIALVALVIVWHLLRAQTPEFDPANMKPGTGPVTPSIRAMILRGQWNAR